MYTYMNTAAIVYKPCLDPKHDIHMILGTVSLKEGDYSNLVRFLQAHATLTRSRHPPTSTVRFMMRHVCRPGLASTTA